MTVRNSTKPKPGKPRRDFPLFAHQSGQWAKKINGRFVYFGPWDDPAEAERKFDEQKTNLRAGILPAPKQSSTALTVRTLCNKFLEHKDTEVEAGEITAGTFNQLKRMCELACEVFGHNRAVQHLTPDDFAKVKRQFLKVNKSPNTMRTEIRWFRSIFNHAYKAAMLEKPIQFGNAFTPPSKDTLRKYRNKQARRHGKKLFTPKQCRTLINTAKLPLRAMLLLALNSGCKNKDLRDMVFTDVDLHEGWLDYPRSKTGNDRVARLWPETVEAINEWIDERPKPTFDQHSELIFLTRQGKPYGCDPGNDWNNGKASDALQVAFRRLMDKQEMWRPGLNWTALRHTYRTWADESGDLPAVRLTMGHVDDSIDEVYREEIARKRLFKVAKHVRWKLFKSQKKAR